MPHWCAVKPYPIWSVSLTLGLWLTTVFSRIASNCPSWFVKRIPAHVVSGHGWLRMVFKNAWMPTLKKYKTALVIMLFWRRRMEYWNVKSFKPFSRTLHDLAPKDGYWDVEDVDPDFLVNWASSSSRSTSSIFYKYNCPLDTLSCAGPWHPESHPGPGPCHQSDRKCCPGTSDHTI